MHQIIMYFLIFLSAYGIVGIFTFVRFLIRYKRTKVKPKSWCRFISAFLLSIIMAFGSLYWLVDCYFIENVPYSFTIEKAMEVYGGIKNYEIFDRIDPEFASEKILLVQKDEDVLVACYIKTRKMLIGLEKYYANGGSYLVNKLFTRVIDEYFVYGGKILDCPNVWYGIIYPENRDKILVNGKIPYFHDIYFKGSDYVFWYIEKDTEKAELVFEVS